MAATEVLDVQVTAMSGKVLWGPASLPPTATAQSLGEEVRQALELSSSATLKLLHGAQELPRGVPLRDAGVSDGSILSIIVSVLRWPWSVDAALTFVEPHLESFFERRPQWQRLRRGGGAGLNGFARGYVRRLRAEALAGTPSDPANLLLSMLSLDTLVLPALLRTRAHQAESEEAAVELVRDICAHAAGLDNMWGERRLSVWPTKKREQTLVGLLLAAHLQIVLALSEKAAAHQVDEVIKGAFASKPDCALIRRELMALRFLDQKPLVGSFGQLVLNANELQSAMDRMATALA